MVALNIRNLHPNVRQGLKERAARHGVSMEEEVRQILTRAVSTGAPEDLAALFLATFGSRHGVELELPDRTDKARDPLDDRC